MHYIGNVFIYKKTKVPILKHNLKVFRNSPDLK